MASLNDWLGAQPFEHKIVVAGNTDKFIEADEWVAEKLLSNATYLSDELVTINGLRIFGSPWTPFFAQNDDAFSLPRASGALAKKWAAIPDNLDILITHTPPIGVLDHKRWGCQFLHARLCGMKVSPKLHVFGHIHEGHGIRKGAKGVEGRCMYVNASLCNERNKLVNKPITVEI